MCIGPPSRLILREQPAADMPAAVVGSKGLGTKRETQLGTKTVESQSKRGAIRASRVSPVRDARFIRRGMKKVFNLWFGEPIFLKFPPIECRNDPADAAQNLLGRGFLQGESRAPAGRRSQESSHSGGFTRPDS
jgi:hypothetical protein